MKITFKDEALSELYETGKTKDRKYKQLCKNKKLVDGYIRAVSIMYRTETTRELHEYSFSLCGDKSINKCKSHVYRYIGKIESRRIRLIAQYRVHNPYK